MSLDELNIITNQMQAEQDQFNAFMEGMKTAFRHDGVFEDFDDFESWLYDHWKEYREERYE